MMLFLILFVFVEGFIQQRSQSKIIKDSIFTYIKRMGHDYQHCATYMGYDWTPGSGKEERKCFVSLIKENDTKKLQSFLDFLEIFNSGI